MDDQLETLYHQLQGLSSVSQLERIIHSVEAELKVTQEQVETFINKTASQLNTDLNMVEMKRLNLSSILNENSKPLVSKISNANDLSYSITRRIRLLDQEKDKINQSFEYIQNIIFLKNEILNCHLFLENKSWKQLSQCINNILTRLPESLLEDDEFVSFVVPTSDLPELPKVTISNWVEELSQFFQKEFEKASQLKDVTKLTEYFLLFPLLMKKDVGLHCYSKFIVNLVNEQSSNLLTNVSKESKMKTGFHSLTLLKVFEIISTIINQHSKLIVENYSAISMLKIMTRIQKECDIQCGLIFDTFWDLKDLSGVLRKVSSYNYPILGRMMLDLEDGELDNNMEEISILEANDICYELASILKNWKMYCNFLKIKWDGYSGLSNNNDIPQPVVESSFILKIDEKGTPTFDKLSTFQLRRSIEKSYDLEEMPDLSGYLLSNETTSPPVTSVIEDVILVLNNVLSRTLETGDEVIIKNMVTNAKRIMEVDLIQLLAKRLTANQPRINAVLSLPSVPNIRNSSEFSRDLSISPRAGTPSNNYGSMFMRGATSAISSAMNFNKDDDLRKLETFIIYLNSIETLRGYLKKLIENLNNKVITDKLFLHYDENGTDPYQNSITKKLSNILNSFQEGLDLRCSTLVDENISLLYQRVISTKLNTLVNDLFSKTEEFVSSISTTNEDLLKFINLFRALYQPYQKTVMPQLFLKLLSLTTNKLSGFLERKIMSLRFTDAGAFALEKNMGYIIGEVSKIDYKLRENFLRVTQIIMVLGLDDDEEDQLFSNDDDEEKLGIKWVLTPNERQRARSLRVDLGK